MRETLFDFINDAKDVVMALHYDTTFGGERQTMALVKPVSGGWDVAWWGRTWQSPEDVRPRHSNLPTPNEWTGIPSEVAEGILASLSRVHVAFGHLQVGVWDDGAIAHVAVRVNDHYVDLRWQVLGPDGWEDLQKWFFESWDLLRHHLQLPESHAAFMMNQSKPPPDK